MIIRAGPRSVTVRRLFESNSRQRSMIDRASADRLPIGRPVNAAFGLGQSGPAPGARIIRCAALDRTGNAADRAIALSDQRMARQVVVLDIIFDIFGIESGERFDLEPSVLHLERR